MCSTLSVRLIKIIGIHHDQVEICLILFRSSYFVDGVELVGFRVSKVA